MLLQHNLVTNVSFVTDLRRPSAAQQTDLPASKRAAVSVPSHEVRYRRGYDPQGSLRRLQPAGKTFDFQQSSTVQILIAEMKTNAKILHNWFYIPVTMINIKSFLLYLI